MTTRLQAEQALTQLIGTREQYRRIWTALMGDGTGTITDPDNADRVFVRVHGLQDSVALVFNKSVPTNRPDLPVLIGATRELPQRVQVLGVDWSALPEWGGELFLGLHGDTHELPDGADPVYVQKRAIVPLRASPQDTPDMTVSVAADYYPWDDGFNFFAGDDTEDLTSRKPGAWEGRYVCIYVDGATNLLAYTNGDAWPLDDPEDLPSPPEGSVPVCAVRLMGTTTAIEEADIFDYRIIVSPMGGSLAPKEHGLDPQHDRHSGRLDSRHIWASVACCGAQ